MKDKIVLVDMNGVMTNVSDYDEYCNDIVVKHDAIGVVLSSVSKEEMLFKLKKGLYDIKIVSDACKIQEKSNTINISVMKEKNIVKYYLDGYETVHIVDENKQGHTILSGEVNEIDRLIAALTRNCIKVTKVK